MIELNNKDCIEFLPTLKDNSVDLILIDPPYIVSKDSGYVNNSADRVDYISKYGKHKIDFGEWDKEELDLGYLLNHFYRLLKSNGTLIIFYDIWKMQELKEIAEKIGFKQPRIGCWQKTNPVPINSKLNYLSNCKEYFATFVKKSKPTFNSSYDSADYFVDEAKDTDIYYYPILHGKERLKHPTQKPLSLISQLIEKHSNKGDIILDCFAGTGTTGEASELLNRHSVLCELDTNYYGLMSERLSKYDIKVVN